MLNPGTQTERSLESPPGVIRSLVGPATVVPAPAPLETIFGIDGLAAVRSSTALTAVRARAEGAPTRLVGLSRLGEFRALIVAPASRFRVFRDLRDRRIGRAQSGVTGNEARLATLRGVVTALELQGLSHRSVEWVDLPAGSETSALINGSVDAIYVTGLHGIQYVRASGARIVFNPTDHRDRWVRAQTEMFYALTVEERLLSQSRESVGRDLASFRTAAHRAATHSQQFLSQLEARLGVPAQDVLAAYGSDVRQRLTVELTEEALQALDELKRFLSRWAFIWTDFEVRTWARETRQDISRNPL